MIQTIASMSVTGHTGAATSRTAAAAVRQPRLHPPRLDARERDRIEVARLPAQRGERLRHVDGVLAGAARDLEHAPALRQVPREDLADRLPVAGGRGCALLHVTLTLT